MKIVWGILILVVGVLIGLTADKLALAVQYPLGQAPERASPQEHVTESAIQVYNDQVVIKLENATWATFANTNSMDPVLDQGSYALEVAPKSPDDIAVGDIITFHYGNEIIIHRVIEKGIDGDGWYFITKGDNNPSPDSGKLRFGDITSIAVAIIY